MINGIIAGVLVLCGLCLAANAEGGVYEADVVVYGDASGGVTTAVQATRMGKNMILGQSAATAACMAIGAETSVQAVPNKDLRVRLLKDGQRLE